MAFKINYSEEAHLDIRDGINYYKFHGSSQIAKKFYQEVLNSAKILRENPYFEILDGGYRKLPLKKFPFIILFIIKGEQILILRIFHTSQNPEKYPPKK